MAKSKETGHSFSNELIANAYDHLHRQAMAAQKQKEVEAAPLSKARSHLDKETERGEHSPKIAGRETSQHGGRIADKLLGGSGTLPDQRKYEKHSQADLKRYENMKKKTDKYIVE